MLLAFDANLQEMRVMKGSVIGSEEHTQRCRVLVRLRIEGDMAQVAEVSNQSPDRLPGTLNVLSA